MPVEGFALAGHELDVTQAAVERGHGPDAATPDRGQFGRGHPPELPLPFLDGFPRGAVGHLHQGAHVLARSPFELVRGHEGEEAFRARADASQASKQVLLVHAASILLGVSGRRHAWPWRIILQSGPLCLPPVGSRQTLEDRAGRPHRERKPKVWVDAASNVWQSPACGFECYGMCGFDPVAIATPHNMAWAMAAVVPPL